MSVFSPPSLPAGDRETTLTKPAELRQAEGEQSERRREPRPGLRRAFTVPAAPGPADSALIHRHTEAECCVRGHTEAAQRVCVRPPAQSERSPFCWGRLVPPIHRQQVCEAQKARCAVCCRCLGRFSQDARLGADIPPSPEGGAGREPWLTVGGHLPPSATAGQAAAPESTASLGHEGQEQRPRLGSPCFEF